MKRPTPQNQLNRLAEQIGNFIEYWGFKKIHGAIWTHLYLSPTPLSALDLISRLKVSKALISLSMKDLLQYQLILQTEDSLEKKNKFYVANPKVFEVIRGVLETRELQMMNQIKEESLALKELQKLQPSLQLLNPERLQNLDNMISGAHSTLQSLIKLSQIDPSFLLGFLNDKK